MEVQTVAEGISILQVADDRCRHRCWDSDLDFPEDVPPLEEYKQCCTEASCFRLLEEDHRS